MPHAERMPKLDKQQRTLLQELSAGEVLTLVLDLLRAKVAELGLEEDALELLELLEMERAQQTCIINTPKKHPKLPCVRKVMARMSIKGLMSVAGFGQTDVEFREKLSGAVEKLRCTLK